MTLARAPGRAASGDASGQIAAVGMSDEPHRPADDVLDEVDQHRDTSSLQVRPFNIERPIPGKSDASAGNPTSE